MAKNLEGYGQNVNMLIFKSFYDECMILGYDKV